MKCECGGEMGTELFALCNRCGWKQMAEIPPDTLLADIDWLINEIERGDHIAWDGDDFLRLLGSLRTVYAFIKASHRHTEKQSDFKQGGGE